MKGSSMTNQELQDKIEQEYKEKLEKRMKQMTNYWEKHPEPVNIVLSEASRNYLKTTSTGKQQGTEWNKLDQKIKDTHARMVSEAIRKLTYTEPQAFHPEQVRYYESMYKKSQRV